MKAYDTDGASNLLTAEEVVLQVSTELKPTIIQIIRTTVESSNVDLNNYGNLVEVILTQLKPVVQACKYFFSVGHNDDIEKVYHFINKVFGSMK